MTLSVAMCTYNGAVYLAEQFDSIARQQQLPDELVVCDDHSSDNTRSLIEAFAPRSPFPVRLYANDHTLGPAQNFARAISLCRGDIIALSDQDDVWHPEKLKRTVNMFSSGPDVGLVFSDAEMVDNELRPLGYRAWQSANVAFGRAEQLLFEKGRPLDVLLTRNVVTGATMAFRAKFRHLALPIPHIAPWCVHDYWIALTIGAVATLGFIAEPLVKYRQHAEQHIGLRPPVTPDRREGATGEGPYVLLCSLIGPMRQRLRERNMGSAPSRALAQLDHLEIRCRMGSKRALRRARDVVWQMAKCHYHRYSDGLRGAARDLLRPYEAIRLRS